MQLAIRLIETFVKHRNKVHHPKQASYAELLFKVSIEFVILFTCIMIHLARGQRAVQE